MCIRDSHNEAIRLNPMYVRAYLSRSVTRFLNASFDAAGSDFSEAIRLDAKNAHANIWRYLSRARGGDMNLAKEELLTGATSLDKGKWPAPVIEVLLGHLNPGALLTTAKSKDSKTGRDQVCEAHFYLGEFYLLAGQSSASANLADAARDCPKNSYEYFAAEAELKRLPR